MTQRTIFLGLLVVLLVILVSLVYVYNKPHRDVVGESPAFELPLLELHNEFATNETEANEKYFNKVVVISGTLTSLDKKEGGRYNFVLDASGKTASGEIIELGEEPSLGKEIKVKGLFIGYENLLEEIQLSECTIVK